MLRERFSSSVEFQVRRRCPNLSMHVIYTFIRVEVMPSCPRFPYLLMISSRVRIRARLLLVRDESVHFVYCALHFANSDMVHVWTLLYSRTRRLSLKWLVQLMHVCVYKVGTSKTISLPCSFLDELSEFRRSDLLFSNSCAEHPIAIAFLDCAFKRFRFLIVAFLFEIIYGGFHDFVSCLQFFFLAHDGTVVCKQATCDLKPQYFSLSVCVVACSCHI